MANKVKTTSRLNCDGGIVEQRKSSSSLSDRSSSGVVTGIDLRTGAYSVFNLGDQHHEEIGVYMK